MPASLSQATLNAVATEVVGRVDQGSANAAGRLVLRAGSTDLVVCDMQNPAFGSVTNGVASANPISTGIATAAGTADGFEVRDRDDAVVIAGTVTASGGGGDLQLDNTAISVGSRVNVQGLTYEVKTRVSQGSGALQAGAATISGVGTAATQGAGALQAGTATVSGAGTVTTQGTGTGTGAGLPTTLSVTGTGPVAVGMPLAEGALAAGETLVVEDSGGNPITTQWSPLTSWRTDSSQLHGMLSFASSGTDTYTVKKGTATSGTAISKSDVLASAFSASVSITISGTTYGLSAADLLDGTITPILDYTHVSGPLCSDFAVGAFLHSGGSAHPHLFCLFNVRAFGSSGNVTRVRCEIVVDNRTCKVAGAQDYAASGVVYEVGGTSIENRVATTLYSGRGYRSRGWWGGDPGIFAAVSGDYVQSTKLMPMLRSDVPVTDEATLSALPQSFGWNSRGPLSQGANDGGGLHFQIGYLLSYDGMYLLTSDQRAFNALWAISDVWGICHGGNYGWDANEPICMRDETTGRPFDFEADTSGGPNGAWGVGNWAARSTSQNSDGGEYAHFNGSHAMAAGASLAYLLTGDYYQLEMLQFLGNWANYSNPQSSYNYSGNWPRKQNVGGETRRAAWPFSQVAHTAALTPDSHPMRTYFEEMVLSQPALWATNEGWTRDVSNLPVGTLGVVYAPDCLYNNGNGVAPWMDDYVVYAMARAIELGFTEYDTPDFFQWKANFSLERFSDGSNGWCLNQTGIYKMLWLKDGSGGWNTMAEAYIQQFGTFSCDYSSSGGLGSDGSIEYYANYALGALGAVAGLGVTGAQAAWDRALAARNTGYTLQDEANLPKWAVGNRLATLPDLLSETAAALSVGHSIKLNTSLPGTMLCPPDKGSDFIKWSNTAFWDSGRKKILFIGKYEGTQPLYRLTYDAPNDAWSQDGSEPLSGGTTNGHGYDHNAGNPDTGEYYFHNYNSDDVYRMDPDTEVWSVLPPIPVTRDIIGGTCWWPGLGYFYVDQYNSLYYDGSWHVISANPGVTSYHVSAEYNSVADCVIYTAGNDDTSMWKVDAALNTTQIATAPHNFGPSGSQGLLVPDPGTDQYIAFDKQGFGWYQYDVSSDAWSALPTSSGDGSSAQAGLPPLNTDKVIACELGSLGVILFIQFSGKTTPASVWLYRHS